MSGEHTPGEWKIRQDEGFRNDVLRPNGRLLATCYPGVTLEGRLDPTGQPEAEANARLISAAPDLLEACQYALNILLSKDKYANDDALWSCMSHFVRAVAKVREQ